jgi:hypothetical protein
VVGDLNQGMLASLAPCSVGGKDYSFEKIADGYRAADISRQLMPADYGHDMPKRDCGKEIAYGDEPFEHLAGNNNTWVSPYEQKKVCEIGKTAFGSNLAPLALGALVLARSTSG